MASLRSRMIGLAGTAIVAASVLLASPAATLAKGGTTYPSYTCTGGEIPAGSYASIKVTGPCSLASTGSFFVFGNIEAKTGGLLYGGTTDNFLWVRGNINVGSGGGLFLGCDILTSCVPFAPTPTGPRLTAPATSDPIILWAFIGGSVNGMGAAAVVVLGAQITKNFDIDGGGLGAGYCTTAPVTVSGTGPFGPFFALGFSTVGGNAEVDHVNTCGVVFFLNLVNGNLSDNDNTTSLGNVVVENSIGNNLSCKRNVPPPDLYWENFVGGHSSGQCWFSVV